MKLLSLVSFISAVFGQASGGLASNTMLMTSLGLPVQRNYTIGYLSPDMLAGTIPATASACRRVGMFKFPALMSGNASSMTLQITPTTPQAYCDIGFTLYTFPGAMQIGQEYLGAFSEFQSSVVDVSRVGWRFTAGLEYYFQIQTVTWDSTGTQHCILTLPWGVSTTQPSLYALVVQQGPNEQPCGSTPWSLVDSLNGGFIQLAISAAPVTPTQTQTPSSSDSTTPTPTPSASPSWSPSPTETQQYSSPIYRATPSTSPTPAPTLTSIYAGPAPVAASPSSSEAAGIATGVIVGAACVVAAAYMANKTYPSGNYRRSLRSPMRRASAASLVTPNPVLNLASNTVYKPKTAIDTLNVV